MKNPWNRTTIPPRIHRTFSVRTAEKSDQQIKISLDLMKFKQAGGKIEKPGIRIGEKKHVRYGTS